MNSLLIIFTKNPEKGRVKTRLAKTIGEEEALKIYIQLLDHTLAITKPLDADKVAYFGSYIPEIYRWSQAGYRREVQDGNDLGERMKTAFKKELLKGYQNIIIIGGDCYQLQTSHLKTAFEKLKTNEYSNWSSE